MNKSRVNIVCIFLVSFQVLVLPVRGQDLSDYRPNVQRDLQKVLGEIEQVYNIRFSYKRFLVEGVKVYFDFPDENTDLETLLRNLLEPLDLRIATSDGKYFNIVPDNSKKDTGKIERSTTYQGGFLEGYILEGVGQSPIPYAVVSIQELELNTLSNEDGSYRFRDLPPGSYTVSAQYLGKTKIVHTVRIEWDRSTYRKDFILTEKAFSLNEVHVVASENSMKGTATSSEISNQAIDHLQATSLAEVMQLIPGGIANNPDLTRPNQVSIRQVNTDNMGSMGTLLMINGTPVSNDANLQLNNTPTSGVNASYPSTAGAGIDFRQISADNIQSVEVIRGIPSVEYGDLTSGAIIVNTRKGRQPFQLKTRINPVLAQVSVGKGFALGKNNGTLNLDLDYTYSVSDQRFSVNSFDRYTGNFSFQKAFGQASRINTTTGFSFGMNISQRKLDPDDPNETRNKSDDFRFRFSHTGEWEWNKEWARRINYAVSIDYGVQNSYQQELTAGGFPITYVLNDTMAPANLVPGTYLSRMWVKGRPLNLFAKVKDRFYINTGPIAHNFLMGVEWKTDANFGEGKIYNPKEPPRLETGVGTRPRSYEDIPALNKLAFYIQDHIYYSIGKRDLSVQAGFRYDNIQPFGGYNGESKHIISPRINASIDIWKGWAFRAGYGISAKSPSLAYLYPQNAYFDRISLNHAPSDPDERLVLVSTFVYPTGNYELEIATNSKKEIGVLWKDKGRSIHLTGFHEKVENGYDYQNTLNTYNRLFVPKFRVEERPVGQLPMVESEPYTYDTVYTDFRAPTNDLSQVNSGLEFDIDFGRMDIIRTSFRLNGAWIRSVTTSDDFYILKKNAITDRERDRVGIYPKGRGRKNERFNTTLRLIHHIPRFRLVATLAVQTIWMDKNRYLGYAKNAIGFLSRKDGQLYWLEDGETKSLDPVEDNDIVQSISDEYYIEESWSPLWLFNLKLTKEIGDNAGFSFFVNNLFMSRPVEESDLWAGQFTRRNPPLFAGVELSVKI